MRKARLLALLSGALIAVSACGGANGGPASLVAGPTAVVVPPSNAAGPLLPSSTVPSEETPVEVPEEVTPPELPPEIVVPVVTAPIRIAPPLYDFTVRGRPSGRLDPQTGFGENVRHAPGFIRLKLTITGDPGKFHRICFAVYLKPAENIRTGKGCVTSRSPVYSNVMAYNGDHILVGFENRGEEVIQESFGEVFWNPTMTSQWP